MPNISFEEKHGASVLRRILAGLWIILALGGGIALVNYSPKTYKGTLEICYNTGSKGEVLSRVESVLQKSELPDMTIESADKERLFVSSIRDNKAKTAASLLLLKDQIKEAITSDIESKYNTDKEEFDKGLQQLEDKLKLFTANQEETGEYLTIIDELQTSLKNRSMRPAGWEVMFEDNARYRSILNELVGYFADIEELNINLKSAASRMLVLSNWISEPQNQVTQITEKRVVQYEDTPELIALKDRKAEIEASRMRLLQRATTRHPDVIRMSAEIDELQTQINALTRTPHVVEDIKEITNPKLAEFNCKIITTRAEIAALNSQLETVAAKAAARLEDLRVMVKDSQKDKTAGRKERIEQEITAYKHSPVMVNNSPIIGYIISGNIEKVSGPPLYLIYSIAGFIGVVGAFLIMYSCKKSSFKLEEVEATPEFPVLGKIGRIGGSKITRS